MPNHRLAFEENLSYRLSMLTFLMGKATRAIYEERGLTAHQWKVLSVLDAVAPIPAYEITKWVTFDKAAISRAVRQLRDSRLVDNRPHATDARMLDLILTKKGAQTYRAMNEEMSDLQASLFAGIAAGQQAAFFEVIDALETRLRRDGRASGAS